jgi:hypothetical protein
MRRLFHKYNVVEDDDLFLSINNEELKTINEGERNRSKTFD